MHFLYIFQNSRGIYKLKQLYAYIILYYILDWFTCPSFSVYSLKYQEPNLPYAIIGLNAQSQDILICRNFDLVGIESFCERKERKSNVTLIYASLYALPAPSSCTTVLLKWMSV